eukprot:38626_1
MISVCANSTISNAKTHSPNRVSLRIVNKHETIDTVYYASDTDQCVRKRYPQSHVSDINILYVSPLPNVKCLMVVLMLMFIVCKCPKHVSFNTVILMIVSGVFGQSDELCATAYECVGQSRPINRATGLQSLGYQANSGGNTDITIEWE